MSLPTDSRDSVIELASTLGFVLLPADPVSKRPIGQWKQQTSSMLDIQRERFAPFADQRVNYAIRTGVCSGNLVVIDLDVHNENANGMDSLNRFLAGRGLSLPPTLTATTQSGGSHLYYHYDAEHSNGMDNAVNKDLGIDIRANGGIVVIPPSYLGDPSHSYTWDSDPLTTPVADADEAVYALIDHVRATRGRTPAAAAGHEGANARDALFDGVDEGGRNDALFRYACRLRSQGLEADEMMPLLLISNDKNCTPPLDEDEVAAICASATGYDKGTEAQRLANATPDGDEAPQIVITRSGRVELTSLVNVLIHDYTPARLDTDENLWYWTGTYWDGASDALDRIIGRIAPTLSIQDTRECEARLRRSPYIRDLSFHDFSDRYCIPFANAVVDAKTLEVVDPSPDLFITSPLPTQWDPGAPCPDADAFIDDLACSDPVVTQQLLQVIGVSMLALKPIDGRAVMLIGKADTIDGTSSNGKSTYEQLIRTIVGTRLTSSLDITQLGNRFDSAFLAGKLVNIGDDISSGMVSRRGVSVLKSVVTGETIHADVKGRSAFAFSPRCTLVYSANEVPSFSDYEGLRRRFLFIPFANRFAPGTPGYRSRIELKRMFADPAFRSRIAYLALQSLSSVFATGDYTGTDASDNIAAIELNGDSIDQWLSDDSEQHTSLGAIAGPNIPVGAVYSIYSLWCETSNVMPCSRVSFTKRMQKKTIHDPFSGTDNRLVVVKGHSFRYFAPSQHTRTALSPNALSPNERGVL